MKAPWPRSLIKNESKLLRGQSVLLKRNELANMVIINADAMKVKMKRTTIRGAMDRRATTSARKVFCTSGIRFISLKRRVSRSIRNTDTSIVSSFAISSMLATTITKSTVLNIEEKYSRGPRPKSLLTASIMKITVKTTSMTSDTDCQSCRYCGQCDAKSGIDSPQKCRKVTSDLALDGIKVLEPGAGLTVSITAKSDAV